MVPHFFVHIEKKTKQKQHHQRNEQPRQPKRTKTCFDSMFESQLYSSDSFRLLFHLWFCVFRKTKTLPLKKAFGGSLVRHTLLAVFP